MGPRLILIGGAALAGLLAGSVAWAALGNPQEQALTALESRLGGSGGAALPAKAAPLGPIDRAIANPLFASPSENGGPEASIRLVGIVRTPTRNGAFLSIGEAPAQWYPLGEDIDGYAVESLSAAGVALETRTGPRQIQFPPGRNLAANGLAQGAPSSAPVPSANLPK